jgi:hypothetical protein
MIPIFFVLLRERPADVGLAALGGTDAAAPPAAVANPARIAIDALRDGCLRRRAGPGDARLDCGGPPGGCCPHGAERRLVRTTLGDYQLAFWSSGALCLLAAVLALQVRGRVVRRMPALGIAGAAATD